MVTLLFSVQHWVPVVLAPHLQTAEVFLELPASNLHRLINVPRNYCIPQIVSAISSFVLSRSSCLELALGACLPSWVPVHTVRVHIHVCLPSLH